MPKQTFFNLPAAKREDIINLSIEEFAENDYKNASISRIVENAGIAKGSFYQYFENKEDLYLYLIQLATEEKIAFMQQMPPPEAHGIFDNLRWLIQAGLNFEFSNPQLAQIGYRAIYGDTPLPTETKEQISEGAITYFRQLAQQGISDGDIDPDLDPDIAAFLLNTIFSNLGDYILKRENIPPAQLATEGAQVMGQIKPQAIIHQIINILERGLGPDNFPAQEHTI